ncbi:MAG: response regulator [Chloroflexi bacterium]|jgi:DNA-binding response OmpR family regulator|uniref:Response regulator n=1 Tax=Candidatus Chlorohelix allophototropha TaxID=3003348 RepID=A0A8T7M787_9CHLR|nr:response regulator [Chloroflexota bacterium]WJW69915.1 response regulator [Chloroflexota bacterium L227-S17]
MKVLIAEDEKDIRRLISFTLERAGFEIVEAVDGKQAIEMAKLHNPNLILLDVMMPYMDGYEVCRRLRSEPATTNTPVLFLSAKGQHHEIGEGLSAGATDYIVKPFTPRELVAKVKELTGTG